MDIDAVMAEGAPVSSEKVEPQAVAVEKPEPEGAQETEVAETEEPAKPEDEKPKELTPAEELEKLRRELKRDNRKIGKLTALKYQLQKENEELRIKTPQEKAAAKQADDRPKESDFEGRPYSEYLDALTDWKVEQKFKESQQKTSEDRAKSEAQEWEEERKEVVDENYRLAKTALSDFDDVMEDMAGPDGSIPLSPHVRKALLSTDNGAFALYAIGKEGLLESVNAMPPEKAAMTIARMEDKGIALSKAKPVTKAPTPMSPARGTAASGANLTTMSGDDMLKAIRSERRV